MATRGRPRNFDREAALEAAMNVFWSKGYTATSMADLYQEMGISSPSLYAAFGSKEALYAEALERYRACHALAIWAPVKAAPTARAAFEAFLMASACELTLHDQPRGCMVTLSSAGSEGADDLGVLVKDTRAQCLAALEARLKRALKEGEVAPGTDIKGVARLFFATQQGMSIQARDGATRKELEGVAKAAMAAWPGTAK